MRDTEFHENIWLLTSFDIKNSMYTNMPTVNLKDIISSMLDHSHRDNKKKQKILKYYNIILYENFFQYRDRQYLQMMGASTSPIFSEIYLQYMEHTTFVDILIQRQIWAFC